MKKLTIVWTITLLAIMGGLTAYGFMFKKANLGNINEEALVNQAEKYLGTYPGLFPMKGQSTTITSEKLKDEGFDPKLENECVGYVIVESKDMGFTYNAYVKCDDYITEGYLDE